MGVIGMSLDPDDEVVGMQLDTQGEALLVASETALESGHSWRNSRCSTGAERREVL